MKTTHPNISIFSFFSGSGFLDLGFEKSGFNIVFVNENHQAFLNAYSYSRKKMGMQPPQFGYNLESIEEYIYGNKIEHLGKLVMTTKGSSLVGFIGGPPCPDFSNGGKNKGHIGDNGRLTKEYIELISLHKPDFFLLENVKGLWKTEKHRKFYDEMLNILRDRDYSLTNHLANALEYGVPQNRDRIMLFGVHKNLLHNEKNSNSPLPFNWKENLTYTSDKIPQKDVWPGKEVFIKDSVKNIPNTLEKFNELTVEHWFNKNDVTNHPNSIHFFKPKQGLAKFQNIDEGDVSRKSFKRLHRWRYSPTTAYGNNEVHLHPYKERRLSASEALAIQSMPKDFELPQDMSLSDMFKTIGNGVPYLMSRTIANDIKTFLFNIIK
ncbi:DNA cytosine methyltransferase [Pantoea sp. SGAir0175]